MLGVVGLIFLGVITVGGLRYLYKNPSAVLDGSTALHYHIVSAHVNYKYKKDPE